MADHQPDRYLENVRGIIIESPENVARVWIERLSEKRMKYLGHGLSGKCASYSIQKIIWKLYKVL